LDGKADILKANLRSSDRAELHKVVGSLIRA
jgi:hypothetical protein